MLNRASVALVVVDVQESLMPKIPAAPVIVEEIIRLIRFARLLGLPILWTEQYPKGLGPTVPEIAGELTGLTPIEKLAFGCMADPQFVAALQETGRTNLLITGVETHICVLQTALGAVERGFEVWVAADAVGAREARQHDAALNRIVDSACQLVTAEMAMFEILEKAGTPEFKQCLPLLKR